MSDFDNRTEEELHEQLIAIETQKARWAALTPAQQIAETLHHKLCYYNHTGQCDWNHGSWDKPNASASVRQDYLTRAQNLLADPSLDQHTIQTVLKYI
jgi:hypothetical protein